MDRTKAGRDAHRADRWLGREGGGLPPLDPRAHAVLAARLAGRRRALLNSPPLLLVGAALLASIPLGGFHDGVGWARSYTIRYLLALLVIEAALLVAEELTNRADRRLTAGLARHVTRGRQVPIRELLGTRATRAATITVAVMTVLGVLVTVADHGGWLTWAYLGGSGAAVALTGVRLRRISTRPTLAGDPTALAIDERLRAGDGVAAVRALAPLVCAFGPGMPGAWQPNSWLWACWMASYLLVITLWVWADLRPRWPSRSATWGDPTGNGSATGDPVYLPAPGGETL